MFAWRRAAAVALVLIAGATLAIGATAPRPATPAGAKAAPAKPATPPATKPGTTPAAATPAPATPPPAYIEPPPAPARRPYANVFPEGEGLGVADRACLFCHSPMLVVQQAKDSAGWEKTINQMVTFGAPLDPAEHDTLLRYLLVKFGPRGAAVVKRP